MRAWSVFSELVKLRLTTLVLITTLVGFYAGLNSESGPLAQNLAKLGLTLLGTGLLAAGAAILNQYLERDHDARMERTARRPLPSGTIGAEAALLLGGACSVVGLLVLAAWVNLLVAVLGAVTLSRTFLFTRRSSASRSGIQLLGRFPERCRRLWGGPRPGAGWIRWAGFCSGFCFSGRCRISWRSPGCTVMTTRRPAS